MSLSIVLVLAEDCFLLCLAVCCLCTWVAQVSVSRSSCDVLLMTVAGMKLLRASFCNPSYQFLTLIFTIIFFEFDCSSASETFLLNFFLMSIVFNKVSAMGWMDISAMKHSSLTMPTHLCWFSIHFEIFSKIGNIRKKYNDTEIIQFKSVTFFNLTSKKICLLF